ncbi:flavin-nucleotide-binding protein-like protein [Halalkalicoccus jeotgali B3]|uniref:Flavin-nucleotide-binding protein-like protein n=2 Tax=Halalkalicoccus jeotgali TaxID=413810 RepID=D8J441_HALJB|nr:pyridoxamine 5'-phosphate oxidase family protein [Halalkalicoccus jeotgali]ADJ15433.1 flavin-nucleotide-binding protein-like protein [Halalkalicoccus jeotgali B3]ELY36158.1 flavin-nucleotide-binding protein-like protein [Halalkalicoccus jeotgali B3]
MEGEELDAFLGRGGTGVLSFSTEGEQSPFSIPVSYGYTADSGTFYFRLAFPPGSTKATVIDRPVTFVVHEHTDEGWQSVVASGRVEGIDGQPYESTVVQELWAVRIPSVDVFDRPPEDVAFRHFRLVPETLQGRTEFTD